MLQAIIHTEYDSSKSSQHLNAQNAVLYEAIHLAIHLDPSSGLVTEAARILADFMASKETNVRYLGLEMMAHLASVGGPVQATRTP